LTEHNDTGQGFAAAEFDLEALRSFLEDRFGERGAALACQKITGGQSNPTYFIDFAGRSMVLRKQPAGPILRGAHAIDREFRVIEALSRTDVPVPRAILYHDDPGLLGTPFYLMERLQGRVFNDCSLPDLLASERRGIFLGMAEALARLHAVRPADVGLEDFGRPGNYFERQIGRWTRQYRESPGKPMEALDAVAKWLPANLPDDDGQIAIAHGDFRLGNMLFHPTEPRVIGILDWELSTLGHPLADLGFCCMPWHTSPEEYGGILGLERRTLGIPSQAEFTAHYFAHAVPTAPLKPFHVVFALFRFAVIFVGIADRARIGTAIAANAESVAPLAGRFAERARAIIDRPGVFETLS
jgi:aminoglycoside phosphotransferase (APT) family kinase protein